MNALGGYSAAALDALREVSNIGGGAAATELYRLTGDGVAITLPRSRLLGLDQVLDAFGDPTSAVTAVAAEVSGDLDMVLALLLSPEQAASLQRDTSRDQQDLLMELGDRLCGAFAHAVGDLAGLHLTSAVAGTTTDMLGAVIDTLVAPWAAAVDEVLLVDVDLTLEHEHVDIHILCIPPPAAVRRLLSKLGMPELPQ